MSALRAHERVPAAAMGASIDAMVRRAPLVLAASLVSAALVACAAFSGGSDGEEPGDRDGAAPDPDSSSGGEGFEPGDARGPDAPAPLCEPGDVVSVTATADVPLYPSPSPGNFQCYGTAQPGALEFAVLSTAWDRQGAGAKRLPSFAIFRFPLSTEERAVLASPEGKLRALALVLGRASYCDGACDGGAFVHAGKMAAYPLTVDWDERHGGTDVELGADYCRRKHSGQTPVTSASWAVPGALGDEERGGRAGEVDAGVDEREVVIPLDATRWGTKWLGAVGNAPSVAVLVAPEGDLRFVAALREYPSADPPVTRPTLRITHCK